MPEPTDLHAIRRNNLNALYREFATKAVTDSSRAIGTDAAFAAHIGVSPSMWSQIRSHRAIGPRVARQIEAKCGLNANWLDLARETPPASPSKTDQKLLSLAQRLAAHGSSKQKRAAITALMAALSG